MTFSIRTLDAYAVSQQALYAEYHYDECRYAKCRGSPYSIIIRFFVTLLVTLHPLHVLCSSLNENYWVQVAQIFEFAKLMLFLKTYLGGGLALSGQRVGSLLIPPCSKLGKKMI